MKTISLTIAIVVMFGAWGCGSKEDPAAAEPPSAAALDPGANAPPNTEAGKDIDGPVKPGDPNTPGREQVGG